MSVARALRGVAAVGCLLLLVMCGKKSEAPEKKKSESGPAAMNPTARPRVAPRPVVRRRPGRPVTAPKAKVRHIEVKIPVKGLTLEGTLSVPQAKAGARRPAFLFVHGSGPMGRKVKVSGVEVFTELAKALTAKGAVVLRYDKRTYTLRNQALAIKDRKKQREFAKRFATLMPDDYIADARAVFDFLAQRPEVDPRDITVVGHSQGGSFGPDIVRGKPARRLILLAPGMQPYDKMLVDQLEHQVRVIGKIRGAEAIVAKTKKYLVITKQLVKKLHDKKVPPEKMLLGASKKFHLRWMALTQDMAAKVGGVKIPTLIIQGNRDLKCLPQVLLKMKPALLKNPKVRIEIVDQMTHELLLYRIGAFDDTVPRLMWAQRKQK